MMIRVLVVLLCLTSVDMIGQSLKKKKNAATFYEEFYTIDKSTKEKQGSYLKIGKSTQDTLAYGSYEQGSKSGVWSFRGRNNSLYLDYDFDQKKMVGYHGKVYDKDSVQVKKDGSYKVLKVDHPARYIGFEQEINRVLKYTIKTPQAVFDKAQGGMFLASFDVNDKGTAGNFLIESSYEPKLNEPVKKALTDFKEGWIPAAINGTPVTSKMYLMINFQFVMGYELQKKTQLSERADLIVIDLIYMGVEN